LEQSDLSPLMHSATVRRAIKRRQPPPESRARAVQSARRRQIKIGSHVSASSERCARKIAGFERALGAAAAAG
jgi:hypothetical protein